MGPPSSFFRSEPVSLCHVYVQNEMAFDIVAELGQLGELHLCWNALLMIYSNFVLSYQFTLFSKPKQTQT